MSSAAQINQRVTDVLGSLGFESHPFLVDWYNQQGGFRLYGDVCSINGL